MSLDGTGAPRFRPEQASPVVGSFSSAFRDNRPSGPVYAIVVSPTLGVVVGGKFVDLGGDPKADYVARWSGTEWIPLAGGTTGPVYALALMGTDIVVGGDFLSVVSRTGFGTGKTRGVARWNSSTDEWTPLGGGLQVKEFSTPYDYVQAVVRAIATDGTDVFVGGCFPSVLAADGSLVGGTQHVARWRSSTGTWESLGGRLEGTGDCLYAGVRALTTIGSDVYAGGLFTGATSAGGASVTGTASLARWSSATKEWSSIGLIEGGSVSGLASDGSRLYVAGAFTGVRDLSGTPVDGARSVARWTTTTGTWSSLGSGLPGGAGQVLIRGADVLVTAGGVMRWDEATGTWSPLTQGRVAYGTIGAFALVGDDLVVGGDFVSAVTPGGGYVAATAHLARWTGTMWGSWPTPGRGPNGNVYAILVARNGDLYVGGAFTDLAGMAGGDHVARWDGSRWSSLGNGLGSPGVVYALVESEAGDIYAGGSFGSAYDANWNWVSGTRAIARWRPSTGEWSSVGPLYPDGTVKALAVSGSDVYIGGSFGYVYDAYNKSIYVGALVRWDEGRNAVYPVGAGVSFLRGYAGYVRALAVRGRSLYVGGGFDFAYGTDASAVRSGSVIRWDMDAQQWRPLGAGVGGSVEALALNGRTLYVGGLFQAAYDGPDLRVRGTTNLAAWDEEAQRWGAVGYGTQKLVAPGNPGAVTSLLASGTELYVAGRFSYVLSDDSTVVSGTRNLARWNTATRQWGDLVPMTEHVYTMALGQAEAASSTVGTGAPRGAAIFLGGNFVSINGVPASHFTYYTGNVSVGVSPRDRSAASTVGLTVVDNGSPAPRLVLTGATPRAPVHVRLFDVLGRRVAEVQLEEGGEVPLDASRLARGVYVARAVSSAGVATATLVCR